MEQILAFSMRVRSKVLQLIVLIGKFLIVFSLSHSNGLCQLQIQIKYLIN